MPARKRSSRHAGASRDEAGPGGSEGEPRPVGRAGTPAQGRELRARGQRTMQRILDAGMDVFASRGYHAARVDDIVKSAKTSHGTFYLYFANKEDLFQALVADVADELAALTSSLEPISAGPEGAAALRDWLDRFTTLYEHYGPVIRTWTEAEVDASEVGRIGTDVLGELAAAVATQAQKGGSDLDPTIAAMAIVAMIERLNYFVVSGQVAANREEMLDTLAAIIHRGLFP